METNHSENLEGDLEDEKKTTKKNKRKIATLFLICLISLAITGYTYSHWTEI